MKIFPFCEIRILGPLPSPAGLWEFLRGPVFQLCLLISELEILFQAQGESLDSWSRGFEENAVRGGRWSLRGEVLPCSTEARNISPGEQDERGVKQALWLLVPVAAGELWASQGPGSVLTWDSVCPNLIFLLV